MKLDYFFVLFIFLAKETSIHLRTLPPAQFVHRLYTHRHFYFYADHIDICNDRQLLRKQCEG